RLCFRLEEPVVPDEEAPAETAAQAWDLRYLLQARDDLSLMLPLETAWRQASVKKPSRGAAQQLLARSGDVREYLLAALGQAAALCPPVEQSLKAPAPAGCELDGTGAHEFLTQHAWQLEQAGFGVFLPSWWTRKGTK